MPMSTRSRVPTAIPQPKNTTAAARKKNPSQQRSGKNKPEQNPVPDVESSEDEVPLAKIKVRLPKPAAKAAAKTKGVTAAKAAAKRTAKVAENSGGDRKGATSKNQMDKTFVQTLDAGQELEDSPQNGADSQASDSDNEQTLVPAEDETVISSDTLLKLPPTGRIQVNPLKIAANSHPDELDVLLESDTALKRGKKNKQASSDDETAEVPAEVTNQEEESELGAIPSGKGRKGKAGPSKKVETKKVTSDAVISEVAKKPMKRGAKKDAPVENNEPMEAASDDYAPEVAKKPAKRGAKNKDAPADNHDPMEAASDDNAAEVVKKPAKRGARKKDTPVKNSEMTEAASDGDAPEVKKPTKRGAKKNDIPVVNDDPMEAESEDDAVEVVKPAKRGARKNNVSAENSESVESESDDDASEVAQKPAKRGAKKQTRKAQSRKEVAKDLENLPDFMDQLDLNRDNVPAKGKKKKGGAGAKSKAATKNNRRKKEADSEPESGTLMKYSSTESLKNITFRSGLNFKSHSEDNLNSLAGSSLDRPRRGIAPKVFNQDPELDSDEEEVVVKKRAPRRKAAK